MPGFTFEHDTFSRAVARGVLLMQVAAMILVLGLSLLGLFIPALVFSFLTLFISFTVILWLYVRYQKLPIVRKKREVERRFRKIESSLQTERSVIQACAKERDRLTQAQKEEIHTVLRDLQKNYIEKGLASSTIQQAAIPGVGPKLKERLASYGILSAAHVSNRIAQLPGFGALKSKALLAWRSLVLARLESAKPAALPGEQSRAIEQKYQALQDQNSEVESKADARKQSLEQELLSLKPRLQQLAQVSFPGYLSRSLASRGIFAALVALVLIVSQVVSSVSATGSAILASIPTVTGTSTETMTPTATATPSQTLTSTTTLTPTSTLTPTMTFTPQPTLPPSITSCIPDDTARETALVIGIVDGDTIDVRINDQIFRVRYIGIDTPEHDQAFYNQAAAHNQTLVYNRTVTLVKDQSETDPFDRLLRYVIVGDTFVNYELVNLGFAEASAYPPDTACAGSFESAQRSAQTAELGLWMPTQEVFIPLPPSGGGGNTGNCHPSYPGVCIPPPPPDLDCKDISYRRFQVLPPDPHRFDGDHDGIGCES